jgi:hypothetical protein
MQLKMMLFLRRKIMVGVLERGLGYMDHAASELEKRSRAENMWTGKGLKGSKVETGDSDNEGEAVVSELGDALEGLDQLFHMSTKTRLIRSRFAFC